MSCTEHFEGKLTPTGKTIKQYVGDLAVSDCYDDEKDYFRNEFEEIAVEIDSEVYTIDRNYVDQDCDIFTSTKNADGTISFEVKYYNGGCGFGEAIEDALKEGIYD